MGDGAPTASIQREWREHGAPGGMRCSSGQTRHDARKLLDIFNINEPKPCVYRGKPFKLFSILND
jgi:hypothetical protein